VLSGARFVFDPFELDAGRRSLNCRGEPVAVGDRALDVLLLLVARAGQIVPKDDLLEAAWKDVAVGDNSLEQVISSLRKQLGALAPSATFIETAARRGYRFVAPVTRQAARESDAGLDALLAPHRAFIEGRAALETLERDAIRRARGVFEEALMSVPELASAHIGLANACVLQFEMTRADPAPDAAALALAARHAREACRLDPQSGEAWATLGFVLDRTGARLDALAASRRAVGLEPDNWRHHFRMAYVSWGEERLRAARRTLALVPGFPLAHWMAASVHVARHALPDAERELATAIASDPTHMRGDARFSAVALHWLTGLLHLAADDVDAALEDFHRELALENSGHLYARECCANTHYALGALHLRTGQPAQAAAAFREAIRLVPMHPLAHAGLRACEGAGIEHSTGSGSPPASFDQAMCRAAYLAALGQHAQAAQLMDAALATAPPGNAGWLLPVEPLIHASARPEIWAGPLNSLRNRAV
jgi:DNA-binding winged helix-turn-helix (wHTH) protein/Flp pilus assembly protein TadD